MDTFEFLWIGRDICDNVFTKTLWITIPVIVGDIIAASEATNYKPSGSHCC